MGKSSRNNGLFGERKNGIWHFPREWTGIEKVDIYTFNEDFTGLRLLEQGRKINKNQIYLSQEPDRAQIIVPAGTDMTDRSTIYSNPPSGTATFICKDVETHGNWKRKYGKRDMIYSAILQNYLKLVCCPI